MQFEFIFDYRCPFAYLGSTQVDRLAEQVDIEPRYTPVLMGAVAGIVWMVGIFWKLHAMDSKLVHFFDFFKGHTHDPETGEVVVRFGE